MGNRVVEYGSGLTLRQQIHTAALREDVIRQISRRLMEHLPRQVVSVLKYIAGSQGYCYAKESWRRWGGCGWLTAKV